MIKYLLIILILSSCNSRCPCDNRKEPVPEKKPEITLLGVRTDINIDKSKEK